MKKKFAEQMASASDDFDNSDDSEDFRSKDHLDFQSSVETQQAYDSNSLTVLLNISELVW